MADGDSAAEVPRRIFCIPPGWHRRPPPLLGDTAMNAGRRGIQQCHNKRVRERDTRTEKLARRYGARAIDAGIQRQRVPRFFASPSPLPDHSHDDLLVACFSSPSTSGCGTSFVALYPLNAGGRTQAMCMGWGECLCFSGRASPYDSAGQRRGAAGGTGTLHYYTCVLGLCLSCWCPKRSFGVQRRRSWPQCGAAGMQDLLPIRLMHLGSLLRSTSDIPGPLNSARGLWMARGALLSNEQVLCLAFGEMRRLAG